MTSRLWTALWAVLFVFGTHVVSAQPFDPAWYRATPSAKIAVAADGVYRITGAELQAVGFPLGLVSQLELLSNGQQVPFLRLGSTGATLATTDTLVFVGRRNTGKEERAWAYLRETDQSSDYYSLYSDTSYYWLRGGATTSLQYQALPTASTLPPVQTTLPDTLHQELESTYFTGDTDITLGSGHPMYTRGEGYFMSSYGTSAVQTNDAAARTLSYNIATPNIDAASSDSVRMWVQMAGGSGSRHRAMLWYGTGTTDLDVADWYGYAYSSLSAAVPVSTVTGTSNTAQVRVRKVAWLDGTSFVVGSTPVLSYVDYVRVAYPRLLRPTSGRDDFWITQAGAAHYRLSGYTGTTKVLALLPEAGAMADLAVTSGNATLAGDVSRASSVWTSTRAALRSPARLSAYNRPALASSEGADYIIITTELLRPSAEALAAYHRSHDGLTTQVVLQDDIFQQFDYGRPTPVAMRRFLQAAAVWGRPARYGVFLGDALLQVRNRAVQPWEVITFGRAVSDAWMGMDAISGPGRTERISLGRIPVRTNAAFDTYLTKLRAYNDAPSGFWQKRALFVSGGLNASERSTLRNYQLGWAAQLSGAPLSLDSVQFLKSSNINNDGSFRVAITQALQEGAAWFSYFGHSSPTVLEINTDYPPEMENGPRLPVFISLGCRTGSFANGTATVESRSFAEDLLIADVDGGIAHWGSSETSVISPSAALSAHLTALLTQDTVRVLGDMFRITKTRYATTNTSASADRHLLQYFLLGDPYTRLRIENKPNFAATSRSLFLGNDAPVLQDGTLDVTARAFNYGLALYGTASPTDSVTIRLEVTVTGQTARTFEQRVQVLDSLDVPFRIPLVGAGEHTLRLTLDPGNAFDEAHETDNTAERRVTVFANGLALAYPQRYGITSTTPTLRVTPSTPSGNAIPVLFELDTTATFTSGFKRTHRTTGATVASWSISPALTPGTSYYWRARVDEAGQENVWVNGTFTADPTAGEGMIVQASQRTVLGNTTTSLNNGVWNFSARRDDIQVTSETGQGSLQGAVTAGGSSYFALLPGWGLLILDGKTGKVRASTYGPTYLLNSTYVNRYPSAQKTRQAFDSLAATLQKGDIVIMRSRFQSAIQQEPSWPTILPEDKARLRALGANRVDEFDYTNSWVMVHKVGDPSAHIERIEPPTTTELILNSVLLFSRTSGNLESPTAGPARRWTSVRADVTLPAGTTATLSVLSATGEVLKSGLAINETLDLTEFDARQHARLRFRVDLSDPQVVGAPQLTRLYARFDPVPDIAVDGAAGTIAARVDESVPLSVSVPILNLGTSSTDVELRYFVVNASNSERLVRTDTLRNVAGGESRTATAQLPTDGLAGTNTLRLVVSPLGFNDPVATNNVLVRAFTVTPDQAPPTFTVRIDGEELPNDPRPVTNLQDPTYPFVSARPTVEILIQDANAVRLIADPNLAQLSVDGRRVSMTAPEVAFTPGTAQNPEARIVYSPDFSGSDSTHTITLRVFDASGNQAANGLYQVHVRVANETALERVLPYPNPMVERTTFAFRLRGADASNLDEFRVRVFTLSGRLVREFDFVRQPDQLQAGALRIGWNKFAWDGTDADGDRLPPGVYLYRVSAKADGAPLSIENGRDVERLVIVR